MLLLFRRINKAIVWSDEYCKIPMVRSYLTMHAVVRSNVRVLVYSYR